MANTVGKVIKVAEAEVGYLEKSAAAYKKNPSVLNKKTEGAGVDNYTKYGRDMHAIYPAVMDFPAAWCDCFVDWCFQKAYGLSNAKKLLGGNFDDYTVASAALYKKKNAWYTKNPKKGDQIFFQNAKGGICHTGLVYKVDSSKVYTIEGNTSSANGVVANGGCVAKKSYTLNYNRIAGYGRPNYTPALPTTVGLKKGDSGEQVKRLQRCLNYLIGSKLAVDGVFGTETRKALVKFQTQYIITKDKSGVYGTKTKAKMKSLRA